MAETTVAVDSGASAAWVEVNEVHLTLYSGPKAAAWWELYRLRHKADGRIATVRVGFLGDYVRVACEDREHAESLRELIAQQGIPQAALKIGAARV